MTASEFRHLAQDVVVEIDRLISDVRARLSRLAMILYNGGDSRLRWNDSVAGLQPTTYAEVLIALRRKIHVTEWADLPRPE